MSTGWLMALFSFERDISMSHAWPMEKDVWLDSNGLSTHLNSFGSAEWFAWWTCA